MAAALASARGRLRRRAQSPTAGYPSSTAGFAAGGAGLAGFSAAAGFASSSAMMRRIDARISSIEGSWTFAGCVISDSTSKPFYTKATKELPVPDMQAGIFIAQARLVPRSSPPAASRAGSRSPQSAPRRASMTCKDAGHELLSSPQKRYVIATIDCKQSARRIEAPGDDFIPPVRKCARDISGRQVCERRPSYRAPDDSARSDRRPWSAG